LHEHGRLRPFRCRAATRRAWPSSTRPLAAMKAEEMDEKHAQNAHAKAAGSNQIQTGPSGRPSTRRSVRHCTAVCMIAMRVFRGTIALGGGVKV
jgi:hypothetical protein